MIRPHKQFKKVIFKKNTIFTRKMHFREKYIFNMKKVFLKSRKFAFQENKFQEFDKILFKCANWNDAQSRADC